MAKKKHIHNSPHVIWVILVVVILVLVSVYNMQNSEVQQQKSSTPKQQVTSLSQQIYPFNFGNQKIMVDNQLLNFVNGTYKRSDGNSGEVQATIENQAFSSEKSRGAAILVYNPGGAGTFYYLVGGLKMDDKDVYSTPILLGDRIKIVSLTVAKPGAEDNGIITVQYLDRPSDASMATNPTQQVTKQYAYQEDGNLIEVQQ